MEMTRIAEARVSALPFLPGLVVQRHKCSLVRTARDKGSTILWTQLEFGSTEMQGTYKVVAGLRELAALVVLGVMAFMAIIIPKSIVSRIPDIPGGRGWDNFLRKAPGRIKGLKISVSKLGTGRSRTAKSLNWKTHSVLAYFQWSSSIHSNVDDSQELNLRARPKPSWHLFRHPYLYHPSHPYLSCDIGQQFLELLIVGHENTRRRCQGRGSQRQKGRRWSDDEQGRWLFGVVECHRK
jgi:hypothetical protein